MIFSAVVSLYGSLAGNRMKGKGLPLLASELTGGDAAPRSR